MFSKILIANRGEIACRIIKTCRRLGIATVAVYSEADVGSRHVRLADEAYCVGPAAARDSYLRIAAIIATAQRSGAQAIHPGYGFLSENEAFAQACADAGIIFIGPPVNAIRAMGSKSAAKALMEQAAVPLVPGYHGSEQAPAFLRARADAIGYPVLIKASAGGGGKGMRVVERSEDFESALASCQREAMASFGDQQVLIEKYLQRPRHIEIQVFGDSHGNIVSLHERDCSAQRRHQKVVEEAPAPGLRGEQRAAMAQAACDAARAVGYVGAGTVEFIVDRSGEFYFMEMNTRLQVEHPVTEMITGLDLVEWQLRVAGGEPLPLNQAQIPLRGHAIEVRVYAEEPEKGFLPSIGQLQHFATPDESVHVRIDSGVEQGDTISPHYDPMIAKLIVWDESRELAVQRLLGALAAFRIVGVGHNLGFLSRLIDHAQFRSGQVDTGLIERAADELLTAPVLAIDEAAAVATLWTAMQDRDAAARRARDSADPHSPWSLADGWRLNAVQQRQLHFSSGEQQVQIDLRYGAAALSVNGEAALADALDTTRLRYAIGTRQGQAEVLAAQGQLHVFADGRHHRLSLHDPLAAVGKEQQHGGSLSAPMPGKIIALLVEPGAQVEAGTPLLVMEAMKMEHSLRAPAHGTVSSFLCAVGEQVKDGIELIDFAAS